jgi:hypothetical protein
LVAASYAQAPIAISSGQFDRLRVMNLVVGLIHLGQAVLMLALSNDFSLPVTWAFLSGPPGTDPGTAPAFDVPLGPLMALFLFLAAVDHLLIATPVLNGVYRRLLVQERNDIRWIEYSVSASLMVVAIAMITGVNDFGALVAIAGANASMILFGMLQERMSRPSSGSVNWLPYLFGCIAGAVPWIVIAVQIVNGERIGSGDVPGFVYGIMISLFLLFNTFSINMVLQYKRTGPWRDYVFGEKTYILLSLIAKSALAWQVFANILVS